MKKRTFKPGFEFIFSLSLMALLGLPPLVSAQNKKQTDLQINIENGDTTINGKNIKELSADDRNDALKNIKQIAIINSDDQNSSRNLVIVTKKKNGNGTDEIVIEKKGINGDEEAPVIADNDVNASGNKIRRMHFKIERRGNDSTFAFNFNNDNPPARRMDVRTRIEGDNDRPMGFNRRNTQNFMYSSTDNNGISTRVGYHVSDHQATLDYDGGKPQNTQLEMLELTDLNIVPEFSAGKTVLMFSLSSKAAAEVKLKDSKGNLLWSDKALNGTFSKSFALGLNGLYYLQVKQGNKVAVKEIMKD